jgi:hypothetical protein
MMESREKYLARTKTQSTKTRPRKTTLIKNNCKVLCGHSAEQDNEPQYSYTHSTQKYEDNFLILTFFKNYFYK